MSDKAIADLLRLREALNEERIPEDAIPIINEALASLRSEQEPDTDLLDKAMEVVMGWCCATKDAEEDLRERLEKLTRQQAQ